VGGLAEYMLVDADQAVLKPDNVSVEVAAASSSAITALDAVAAVISTTNNNSTAIEGKRVLVLGGSGGVGSAAIQLVKRVGGASFVATTSTQAELCQSLGADEVVNYRNQDWWTHEDFINNKFDVIIDTVGGKNHFDKSHAVLKTRRDGGCFVAVAGDDTVPDMTTWWKALKYMFGLPIRPMATKLSPGRHPAYIHIFPGDNVAKGRQTVLEKLGDGSLKIPLHQILPFTEEGVRKAFEIVASGHAHGKVVVKM